MADYKSTTKEGKCVFCEFVNGNIKIPGKFWENKKYIAFLSGWPNTKGFTVVIPKKHFGSDVLAMSNEDLQDFILVAKTVSNILVDFFDDVGRVGLMMEGTGIDHAHIKLFPMHGTKDYKLGKWKQMHSINQKYFDKYEGYFSSNDGPKESEEKLSGLAKRLITFQKQG